MSSLTSEVTKALNQMSVTPETSTLEQQLKNAELEQKIRAAKEWTWEREAQAVAGIDPVLSKQYQESTQSLMDLLQGQSAQPAVYVQPASTSSSNYLIWIGVAAAVWFFFLRKKR